MDINNLQYGDQTTADLMLRLLYCNGSECEGNPIHLHSHLLSQKSEYFNTLLSGRWSSPKPHPDNILDFTINKGSTPDEYIRCLKLLYAPEHHRNVLLSGVSETLKTLQVASQWLILEAAEACMEYLEAIPWSDDEALQIKILISSLQLEVCPNLAARLYTCQSQYLKIMEIELRQMLSSLCAMRGNTESLQATCYEYLAANCTENCSKHLKDLTKSLVLQEAKSMLASFKRGSGYRGIESVPILLWFIHTLRSMGVTEYVSVLGDAVDVYKMLNFYSNTKIEFLNFLDDAFKKMTSGKMILRRKNRLKLVTNWLPIIQSLPDDFKEKNGKLRTGLQQGLGSVISTLPAEDHIQISKTWNRDLKDFYSTATYSYWIEKLRSDCNRL